jgi:hypothetical protein
VIAIVTLLLIAAFFYWFQWRPAQIKHDCSWVKMHSNPVSYRPAMTRKELESKGIIRTCRNEFELVSRMLPNYNINSNDNPSVLFDKNLSFEQKEIIWNATSCRKDGDRVIAEYKTAIKATPAKNWYEKATDQEYKFCIRDRGL